MLTVILTIDVNQFMFDNVVYMVFTDGLKGWVASWN